MSAIAWATQRYRRFINAHSGSAVVLLYHRLIDDDQPDPERLGISSELFAAHLAMIAENFATPSLSEICERLRAGQRLPRSSVCVTFDDGYRDNFERALPLLEAAGIPATFFIATLPLEGCFFAWDEGLYPPSRHAALYADEALLRQVARGPLVTLGAHTHTHRRLSTLAPEEARADIARNLELLSPLCGQMPRLFSYPFGDPDSYTPQIVEVVRSFDFDGAFTTTFGTLRARRDPALLMRYYPAAQSAGELARRLRAYFGDTLY
ncbi:MAG: polysaccharide deacetylase family protein [Actinomycetia bacterium]|nr:polysaccharide deacetylase family protein [Actinomycetes bacterium]